MANFSFNKAIIGGRLTAQPELKTTPSGTNVTTFTIAVNRRGGKDGQTQSDFINCVAWDKRAELICKFFGKGSSICVVGEIQTRSWKDNNGNNRYATEVIVSEVQFVDSKSENPMNEPSFTPKQTEGFVEMAGSDDLPF
jgi:single-strand DNA-binding protein